MKHLQKYIIIILALFNTCAYAQKVGVLGTGYVGLVLGACLAEFGHHVICADIDSSKIQQLQRGIIPIYEPGLETLVHSGTKQGNLTFTDNIAKAIQTSKIVFIAVGTPMAADGQADLSAVEAVCRVIGHNLDVGSYKVICTKSTVPIGTSKRLKQIIAQTAPKDSLFDVAFNPEFLREGSAVYDFMHPDRIVIGTASDKALEYITHLYAPLIKRNTSMVVTDDATAETIKYASNSFLAVKVAYINEIAQLCQAVGADMKQVTRGMAMDERIGAHFLNPGPGFGGSCFPKDAQEFVEKGKSVGVKMRLVATALKSNELHKQHIAQRLAALLDTNLQGKTIALLGLAFKANTDDIRYSCAIPVIDYLHAHGAQIQAYDPAAMSNMKKIAPAVRYANSLYDAVRGADAVLILTEWDEFSTMDLAHVAQLLKQPVLFDARNIISTDKLKDLGFRYANIGNACIQ
jgi:UDPglucose 6-dehydrogenase